MCPPWAISTIVLAAKINVAEIMCQNGVNRIGYMSETGYICGVMIVKPATRDANESVNKCD